MNDEKDKGLDDLFRKKLEDPVDYAGYREKDWGSLDQMLDKHQKPGRIIYWLPILSSAAAVIVAFFVWWAFQPVSNKNNEPKKLQAMSHHQQTGNHTAIGGSNSHSDKTKPENGKHAAAGFTTYATTNSAARGGSERKPALMMPGEVTQANVNNNQPKEPLNNNEMLVALNGLPAISGSVTDQRAGNLIQLPRVAATANTEPGTTGQKSSSVKSRPQLAYRPQLTLSVLAAPDLNGVGSFQQSKVGTNIGMLFSVGISKKLTISTGALYSAKPYITSFDQYHTSYQFKSNPVNVTADCRMFDIPLNVGYLVYHQQQNKISVGTGLSSYLMLKENYTFNYSGAYPTGPAGYTVPNSSKYFFGVLNLNATYQRQLNSKVGISVEPYLKLPLTNIGYSQVRLQSTGVAVGFTWNLNPLTKP